MDIAGLTDMARKESITKEAIFQAAFELLKEEGIEQVTARKLAADRKSTRLNSSHIH